VDEANQIETITGGWITPTYDDAGNMIYGPDPDQPTTAGFHYVYDAWNVGMRPAEHVFAAMVSWIR
jgi:hypothetical protein